MQSWFAAMSFFENSYLWKSCRAHAETETQSQVLCQAMAFWCMKIRVFIRIWVRWKLLLWWLFLFLEFGFVEVAGVDWGVAGGELLAWCLVCSRLSHGGDSGGVWEVFVKRYLLGKVRGYFSRKMFLKNDFPQLTPGNRIALSPCCKFSQFVDGVLENCCFCHRDGNNTRFQFRTRGEGPKPLMKKPSLQGFQKYQALYEIVCNTSGDDGSGH